MSATPGTPLAPISAGPPPRVLVLGYGNPGRQDDGLGPAAAAAIGALGWPGVTTWDNDQLVLEDVLEIAAHDVVWFVDAAREGPEPCGVQRLQPADDIAFSSHHLPPEAILAIARQQFGTEPDAHLLAVRGYAFAFEEGLTARAADNLALAIRLLKRHIARVQGRPVEDERARRRQA